MLNLVFRRIAGAVFVLLAVSALVFAMGSFIPGDLTSVIVGQEGATDEQFEEVRRRLGLDRPLPVRYLSWLGNALTGDFGTSPITGREVASDLAQQIPVSLELATLTLVFSTVLGLPAGILAAVHANRRVDVVVRSILLFTFSVPIFVIGVLLLLVGSRWFPGLFQVSYVPWSEDAVLHMRSMLLPLLTIGFPITAMTMQMVRSAVLEVLHEPFITTARAGGVRERRIEYLHALRSALPPIVTFIGFQFGILLGGLIVVEQIFSLPGLGRGMLEAINTRDYPMVTATALVFAFAFVAINVIVDLLYPLLDPRQR
ncbi:glutathione ABC transporter permease GsiC [Rhodobacteraceae bacterium WD3A24]|nr:glutathione ABC transporter permease GsiC [Rhodobacteraceae bacterium WD3A24]